MEQVTSCTDSEVGDRKAKIMQHPFVVIHDNAKHAFLAADTRTGVGSTPQEFALRPLNLAPVWCRGKIPIPQLNISVVRHALQVQLLTLLFRKLHVLGGSHPLWDLASVIQYRFQVLVMEFCAFFWFCITYVCPVQTKRFRRWHRPPMPEGLLQA
jgi:hypothetical protein